MKNELALHSRREIESYFAAVWQTMRDCIDRGLNTEGVLPGPLRVPRRAAALRRMLVSSGKLSNDPMNVIDWVNMFALAVNEENAAGGRVVTAPTNGACGIVPAVLAYYDHFIESVSPDIFIRYFMAAGAVGVLYKMNASISGAEVGCGAKWASPAQWRRRASRSCWAPARNRFASRQRSAWSITSASPAIRSPVRYRCPALNVTPSPR